MDQTQNKTTNPLPQNLISDSDIKEVTAEGNLSTLPGDLKQKAEEKAKEVVLDRVFTRIAYALTDSDLDTLQELDGEGAQADTVKYFLLTKIPNLEEIVKEEIEFLKEENSTTVS